MAAGLPYPTQLHEILMIKEDKNLIILVGSKGYVMCGYLNMAVANRFGDVAVKISGISTIAQAKKTKAAAVSAAAKKLGIYKGQPIKEVLKIIA